MARDERKFRAKTTKQNGEKQKRIRKGNKTRNVAIVADRPLHYDEVTGLHNCQVKKRRNRAGGKNKKANHIEDKTRGNRKFKTNTVSKKKRVGAPSWGKNRRVFIQHRRNSELIRRKGKTKEGRGSIFSKKMGEDFGLNGAI